MYEPGIRVGAVSHKESNKLYLFGYGVYDGDFPYPGGGGLAGTGMKNPRITLDSGKIVWGCECWWGPEEIIQKQTKGLEVVELDIEAERHLANPDLVMCAYCCGKHQSQDCAWSG